MTSQIQARPVNQQILASHDSFKINSLLKQTFGPEASVLVQSSFKDRHEAQYYALENQIAANLTPNSLASDLHKAALSGDLKMIKAASTEQLSQKDLKGLTPLHYAIIGKQKAAVEALLAKSDLSYSPVNGNSYLHYAAMTGNANILNPLLGKVDASLANKEGKTAAHFWAATSDDLQSLKKIFEAGAPMNSSHPAILSPLSTIVFRAVEKNRGLISSSDIKLLLVNVARLFLLKGMQDVSYSKDFANVDLKTSDVIQYFQFNTARTVLGLYKRSVIQDLQPAAKKGFVDLLATPGMGIVAKGVDGILPTGNAISTVSSLAAAAVVGKRALEQISRSQNATTSEKLFAIPVHVFNAGCGLFDAIATGAPQLHSNPDFMDSYNEMSPHLFIHMMNEEANAESGGGSDGPVGGDCTPVSADDYKAMPLFERLTDPKLTENLSEKTGKSKSCLNNFGILLNPENQPTDCKSAKKVYYKLSLDAHPDKCDKTLHGAEKCQNAFANVANALEAFCPKKMSSPE